MKGASNYSHIFHVVSPSLVSACVGSASGKCTVTGESGTDSWKSVTGDDTVE